VHRVITDQNFSGAYLQRDVQTVPRAEHCSATQWPLNRHLSVLVRNCATLVVCGLFVSQKLQKVGQGVMRLAARKPRKDVVTKQVYVSSQVSLFNGVISLDFFLQDLVKMSKIYDCCPWSMTYQVTVQLLWSYSPVIIRTTTTTPV